MNQEIKVLRPLNPNKEAQDRLMMQAAQNQKELIDFAATQLNTLVRSRVVGDGQTVESLVDLSFRLADAFFEKAKAGFEAAVEEARNAADGRIVTPSNV